MLHVHSFETFGTQDGPGIRLVVFLQGCNFRCVYCHNPDTQVVSPTIGTTVSTQAIMEKLEKQRGYFGEKGGLTISGGEPTLQTGALLELFTAAKAAGFHTCLDTNGSLFNESVEKLYALTDLVMLDVKHIDPIWHKKITGSSNDVVLKCASFRESTGKPLWLRYVLVPGWTDQPEYIHRWAKHFTRYQTVEKIELLPYHLLGVHKYSPLGKKYPLEGVRPPSAAIINRTKAIMQQYLPRIVI